MKKKSIWLIVALVGLVYFFFNPSNNVLFPKCPFYVLTGLKCPGCGSQRAVHSLLHFDFASAFGYNALLVFSLPIVVVLIFAEIRRTKNPLFYFKLHNVIFIWSYFAIVVAWWIGRNLFGV